MKNIIKSYKYIFIICGIFFLIRLPFLDQASLLHDERDIVLTGYSLAQTGRDLAGNWFPLSFPDLHPKTPFFSIYFSALGWLLFPIRSVFFARLPFVIVASVVPFVTYVCLRSITGNSRIAYITAIIVSFNPWILHLSRLALEINIVLPATIAGIALYLNQKKKWAYLLFGIVFFTYQGFRVLLPLIFLYLGLYEYMVAHRKTSYIRTVIPLIALFGLLVVAAVFIDGNTTKGRLSELIFFQTEQLVTDVNFKRNTSVSPPIFQKVFHNKVTSSFDYILGNFTKAQDMTFLFKEGDSSPINGSASAGQFFFPFIICYYAGFVYLGKKGGFRAWYPVGFILLGFIPSLLSGRGPSFAIRSAFSVVGYGYIIATGFLLLTDVLQRMKHDKKIGKIGTSVIYGLFGCSMLISVIYFGYNYFFRRPVFASESFFEHERQLSAYLESREEPILVYHPYPNDGYLSYIFFDTSVDIKSIHPDFTNKSVVKANRASFGPCPAGKLATSVTPAVYAEACLTEEQYESFLNNGKIKKIAYQDFSNKIAYFIVE